jgi:SSS family solute:Na+ symporter
MNVTATIVFVLLFVFVTIVGFLAARWRAGDLSHLHEWGLAGRRFGTFVTWFLLGGDLYTAYTFVAVPALIFGGGAIGFFAVPYTIMIYPILYLFFPRLWRLARDGGHITTADIVEGLYHDRWLALAIALTGLLATMPYIALQLIGMAVVIGGLGFHAQGWLADLPLIIAFLILAAFTYTSGLRAPALIAVVKDTLIYLTVFAAIIVVPWELGGFSAIFAKIPAAKLLLPAPPPASTGAFSAYGSLALGSAIALFLYPHSMTAILSSSSGEVIRRNASILPAYSFLLGLLALLGFMAAAWGVDKMPAFHDGFAAFGPNFAIPALFLAAFPSWFVGVAFAAIAIGALVPAAIMSIAAANLFTRNIWKAFVERACPPEREAAIAKFVSLVVKAGALVFIIALPQRYAIELQLLGGVWISQTAPALLLAPHCPRLFSGAGLLLGWAAGMAAGTAMAAAQGFQSAVYPLHLAGYTLPGYAALYALALNLAVALVLSPLTQRAGERRERG